MSYLGIGQLLAPGFGSVATGFTPSDVPQAEADALIALYNTTNGDSWTDNTGWTTDPVVGNWYGVTVSGGHVTQIGLQNNGLSGTIAGWDGSALSSLVIMRLYDNSISGDVSAATWPASLQELYIYITSISGDVSAATWPASLTTLYLYNTSVSGDVSAATWPASLVNLYLYNTSISGDVSAATWPASLVNLYLYNTSVSGDVSAATWPASLQNLRLSDTSVSGDVSAATWPASLQDLWLHITSVGHAGGSGLAAITSIQDLRIHNCSLTQTEVDNVVADIYGGRAGFTHATPVLNVGGTNAAPSGTYQDGDPPTTGKEYIYELENDPESEGFNVWAITYTA